MWRKPACRNAPVTIRHHSPSAIFGPLMAASWITLPPVPAAPAAPPPPAISTRNTATLIAISARVAGIAPRLIPDWTRRTGVV
jgi:hypothetical protein